MELFSHAEARLGVYMDAALDVKGTRGCSAAEKGSFEEIDTRSLALVRDYGSDVRRGGAVLWKVAMGEEAADLVVRDAVLFDPFTKEFLPGHAIWVKHGRVAYSGEDLEPPVDSATVVIQADGMVLLPGLIDSHTHVVNRSGVEELVRYALLGGVTTVITETMELAPIVGKQGITELISALKDQPLRFYYTVPALCGLTEEDESNAPPPEEMIPLLEDPACVGVGEIYWGNAFLPGVQGQRVRKLLELSLERGKRVEGHTAGAGGKRLQAYTSMGVSSCHEPITSEEVLQRLRLGYWVMIREGGVRRELEGIRRVFEQDLDLRRLVLCTDSVDPEGFLSEGYLDGSLRRALKLGVEPAMAYQMVTLNPAEHFGLDHLLGSLAPGRAADFVLVPSPEDYDPRLVAVEGKVVTEGKNLLVEPRRVSFPESFFHTVKVHRGSFRLPDLEGKVRAMELVTRLVTKESILDFGEPGAGEGLNWVVALDRLGTGKAFVGLLKGFGLSRGACGSTMCWDTGDMVLVGCDPASMATVLGRIQELGGGAVYAIGEEVVAEHQAVVCGVISQEPMGVLRDRIKRIEEAMAREGVPWEKSLLTVDTLPTAAIPHLRITHRGYVRLKDRNLLGLKP